MVTEEKELASFQAIAVSDPALGFVVSRYPAELKDAIQGKIIKNKVKGGN